ncbi:DUF3037 domain-containing protein [Actinomycetota bacterium]
MSAHPYQYVVLRCVPRVDREEFLNVGVVVYSQSADVLALEAELDHDRLHAAFPSLDVDCAEEVLDGIRALVRTVDEGGSARGLRDRGAAFGWLSAPRSTVIQPGPVHGGIAADPRAAARDLAERLAHGQARSR